MTPLLEIKNLSVRRGGVSILHDIQWTVRAEENWSILGANGSGKTSLLRAIGGYLPPTTGSIRLLGQEYGTCDWRQLRCHIGIVSASIGQLVHDEDSALEIVAGGTKAMIGHWKKIPPLQRTRALTHLSQLGMRPLASRPWLVLSQGERQRVLIARALMADSRLLILDEPCSGLDPIARERFLAFLQNLATSTTAPPLILVTHHIEEIMPGFTHALLLRNGHVTGSGTAADTLTSSNLSLTFGHPLRLKKTTSRYRLAIEADSLPSKG